MKFFDDFDYVQIHFLTIFVNFGDDLFQRLLAELVAQHGQYRTHHVGTDATLFVMIEGVERFLQNYDINVIYEYKLIVTRNERATFYYSRAI